MKIKYDGPLSGRTTGTRPPKSTWEAPPLPEDEEKLGQRFRLAMALKEEIGLTDESRYALAQMVPGVDKDNGGSWKALTSKQLHTLLNYLEGYVYVTHLLEEQ